MKIVILGAGGQVGTILYETLRKKHDVTGTSRHSTSGLLRFDPFSDRWSILGKPDVIINSVGQIAATRKHSFSKIHLGLTKRIIENRNTVGNPRIIQISALGASATHDVEFMRTKGEADDHLIRFPNVTVVRPSIVCTPGTMIARKMLMLFKISQWLRGMVVVPEGFPERQMQPVMGEDVAAVVDHLCSASETPKILNVVGPERLTFHEIIDLMFKAKGKHYRLIRIPKAFTDVLVNYGISRVLPGVINAQQYNLLFRDNIADPKPAQLYIERPLMQTRDFWINEFRK
jgi:nucleoside-diphosphate-sugar epimerase